MIAEGIELSQQDLHRELQVRADRLIQLEAERVRLAALCTQATASYEEQRLLCQGYDSACDNLMAYQDNPQLARHLHRSERTGPPPGGTIVDKPQSAAAAAAANPPPTTDEESMELDQDEAAAAKKAKRKKKPKEPKPQALPGEVKRKVIAYVSVHEAIYTASNVVSGLNDRCTSEILSQSSVDSVLRKMVENGLMKPLSPEPETEASEPIRGRQRKGICKNRYVKTEEGRSQLIPKENTDRILTTPVRVSPRKVNVLPMSASG